MIRFRFVELFDFSSRSRGGRFSFKKKKGEKIEELR